MMINPAIVLIAYNRPDSLQRLLESIKRANYESDQISLVISIDRADNFSDVYDVANSFEWIYGEKIIRTFDERQGLKRHVLSCGDLTEKYGAIIALEDDLIVSEDFYRYATQALNFYNEDQKVAGIALYSHGWNGYSSVAFSPVKNQYDTYYGQFSITWGQCWTQNQWKAFRKWQLAHDEKLPAENNNMPSGISNWGKQSWGKYFVSYIVAEDLYYVIPYTALSTNFSEVGTHNAKTDNSHQVRLQSGSVEEYRFAKFEDAVKYDVFFERIFPEEMRLCGCAASDVCVNLNGKKKWNFNKPYCLSAKTEDYVVVGTFGLRMHPIDQNIDFNIQGDGIYLYDVTQPVIRKTVTKASKRADLLKRIRYEAFGLNFFQLYPYVLEQFVMILREKFGK